MLRRYLFVYFLALTSLVFGQTDGSGIMLFTADQPLSIVEQKNTYETLSGLDPEMKISFDVSYTKIKLGTSTIIARQEIIQALAAVGVTITYSGKGLTTERSATGNDTSLPWAAGIEKQLGDDPQLYRQAKEQWILEHPEEYEQLLTNPVPEQ